ncbi:MAG: sulfatase, partial [Planctomycetaceae bacterium]|nr:sulfatase [Planctomycetaceae bacterium]
EGTKFYETPHIDGLAEKSLRFERGYSACQVCSPSRAAIQTGRYPARLHLTDYIAVNRGNQPDKWNRNTQLLPAEYAPELPLSELTIAEALKSKQYQTFFAGKWHLGGDGHTPNEQGYDVNQGGYHYGTPPGGFHAPYNNPKLSDDPPGSELPMRLGRETASFIKQQADSGKPFFAMLSFYSVHAPIQCSQARWEKFQAKAEQLGLTERAEPRFLFDRTKEVRQVQDHPVYAGMMAALDDSVGLVLDAIQEKNIQDNTVVIFTSDNGGVSSGDGFATSCLPMRGGKGRQWEGGIRQPFYIYWPGVTTGGTTDILASGVDFLPTILEIAGVDPSAENPVDGVSLVPALRGKGMPDRKLYWHYPHYGNQGGEPSAIVMEGDWKLIHYFEDGRNELYNVKSDVGEQHDLAGQSPEKVAAMAQDLRKWLASVEATYPSSNPRYNQANYDKELQQIQKQGMPNREKEHAGYLKPDFAPRGGWWDQKKP